MKENYKTSKILKLLFTQPANNDFISEYLRVGSRTTLRLINELINLGYVTRTGRSKSTKYNITSLGRLMYVPDESDLSEQRLENDNITVFKFDLIDSLDQNLFSYDESRLLEGLKKQYKQKIQKQDKFLQKREFERLIIEFSWKSSQIEGNTYTLLETEELLSGLNMNIQSAHSKLETQMILNHKTAFEFVLSNKKYYQKITLSKILELHKLITHDLGIPEGLRMGGVGITGTTYKPLDNKYQIQEALESMCDVINKVEPFQKALIAGLIISYIQPFYDGNKRTSRILSNSLLYAYDCPLLSFRSVSVEEYRNAVISFYELGSVTLYKKLFISQLEYFVKAYF